MKQIKCLPLFQIFFLCMITGCSAFANNISVSNIELIDQNAADHYILVKFDITWENSWRTSSEPYNWDAAWVFIKFRISGGVWQHAKLNISGITAPAGSMISPASEGTGIFIYRDADGTGTNLFNNVQLRWNYGANGVADDAAVDLKVFALEMVCIPEGSFYAGSGGTETSAFYKYPAVTTPFYITAENEIAVGTEPDNLYYSSSPFGGDQSGPIPAAFPKGYKAFYCMKYEISQQGYVDFLNTLTTNQAAYRFVNHGSSFRYGISKANGVYSTSSPFIPCSYLNWADLAAYLDWSALRPLTELEFEKACRGTLLPVPNEYAWGTTLVSSSLYTLSNSGTFYENIDSNYNTSAGNAAYKFTTPYNGNINGPLRTGIFAGNGLNSGRVSAGATFYGVMEMSGNLLEHFVTTGNPEGRGFTDTNGDGELDNLGNANVLTWPGTSSLGAGFRGGYWYYNAWYMRISERSGAAGTDPVRYNSDGGRGGRTSP